MPPISTIVSVTTKKQLGPWALDAVHNADCLAALQEIPSDSFDVVVTSPPYWGQRESSGIGSESDPRTYVDNLTTVLAETLRCLKPTGTLWLNLGDAYNTPINWRETDLRYSSLGPEGTGLPAHNSAYTKKRGRRRAFIDKSEPSLQYGNLLGLPYRVILKLCDKGFLFRGEVIWEKSRPLPEGRCRRPHRRHESIYILAKNERHAFRTNPPVGSVWKLVQTPNLTPHCSTFPIDLPLQCIKAAGIAGRGIVFDPFMGSGTTAKAALSLGHHYLGFEIERTVCDLAQKHISAPYQIALMTHARSLPKRTGRAVRANSRYKSAFLRA
ncbi:MAG: DNA-methyltransferase [Candidatus Binataceae bacterium]